MMNWTLVGGACALFTLISVGFGIWAWKHPSSREMLLQSDRAAATFASIVCFPIYLSLVVVLVALWFELPATTLQVMATSLGIAVCITPGCLLLTRVPGISSQRGHIGFTISLSDVIIFIVVFPGFWAHHRISQRISATSR